LEAVVSFADFSPESLGVVDEPVSGAARIISSPRASVEDAVLPD